MDMINLKEAWECSYKNKDNFVFYPNEEIIRFSAKHIVKRIGLADFHYSVENPNEVKLLDLGCGIGRHVIFFEKMNIETYGIDLSEEAIQTARTWAKQENIINSQERLVQGNVMELPWSNDFFDFIVSHGVLDSMPIDIAKKAINEAYKVLKEGGLFYCDLISGDDSAHFKEFDGEETVNTEHEKNTIQSYFNYSKICELVECRFHILECKLIKYEDILTKAFHSRYHLVLKKIKRS